MKAIVINQAGSPENLIVKEIPAPSVKSNEVLVKVKAIGINPVDAFVRSDGNRLKNLLQLNGGEENILIGWDISGVVTETGRETGKFNEGDEVFGMVNFPGYGKAYAEYVAAPEAQLALKPGNISHAEAAASDLAALTAWQALVTYAKIEKGDKVLIHGASGGVGHYAVQFAKYFGAYVVGSSSAANRNFVLSLGADEHIDYENQIFENIVQDADIVLDSVRGNPQHLERSLNALKPGGRLISLLSHFDEAFNEKLKSKNVFGHRLMVVSNGEDMEKIAGLFESGDLKSYISHIYSFDEMPKAHQQIVTHKTRGKIVVEV